MTTPGRSQIQYGDLPNTQAELDKLSNQIDNSASGSRMLKDFRAPAAFTLRSRDVLPTACQIVRYVVAAQFDEYTRLYGRAPARVDGHHHMHLCANVLMGRLIPDGTIVPGTFRSRRERKGSLTVFIADG